MKILPNQIAAFLQHPPTIIRGVLIYGPDSGLVSENFRLLSQAIVPDIHDPFRVTELSPGAIKDDVASFADELASLSMMGGRRLIRVREMPASASSAMEKTLQEPPGDGFFIFTAGELPPASSLRKLFETAKHLAALPCYVDEGTAIHTVIACKLKANGFTCDPQALPLLAAALAGDRMVILTEIEKLMLYMGSNTHITPEDVLACIGEPLTVSLDKLCGDIAGGKSAAVQAQVLRLYKENIGPVTILRAVSRYFMRLASVKAAVSNGVSPGQAVQALRPPVFFKQVTAFTAQVNSWPEARLMQAIRSLLQIEAECKKTGAPAEILCSRLLMSLARVPQSY